MNFKVNFFICTAVFITLISSVEHTCGQTMLKDNGALRFNTIAGYNIASNEIWKTKQSMNGIIGGFEIGYSNITSRNESWHKVFGTPRIGVTLQTLFMNKPDTFGTCISLLPNIEIRLLTWPNSELSGKIAIGGTYCTRKFNNSSNFDNRAISSPLNFGLEFSAVYHHEITQKLELNLEASFFHVSNGSFSLPNGGYNVVYGKAGINYFFNEVPYLKRRGTFLKSYNEKPYYSFHASFAYREQGTYWNQREYPVYTVHQSIMKKLNKIHAVGVGLDGFYDASHKLDFNPDAMLFVSDVKESEKYHVAIGGCYELVVGRMSIPIEAYHYIWNLKIVRNATYLRFGVKYNVWKNLFVGGFVKGGFGQNSKFESAFMEMATGWSFHRKY